METVAQTETLLHLRASETSGVAVAVALGVFALGCLLLAAKVKSKGLRIAGLAGGGLLALGVLAALHFGVRTTQAVLDKTKNEARVTVKSVLGLRVSEQTMVLQGSFPRLAAFDARAQKYGKIELARGNDTIDLNAGDEATRTQTVEQIEAFLGPKHAPDDGHGH